MISDPEKQSQLTQPRVDNEISISIIVPAYNEEKGIEKTIKELQVISPDLPQIHEILVVDDGSTDRTSEILRTADGIKYIRHPQNRGYGAALKTGMNNANGTVIVICDADGTYPSDTIPELIKDMGEYDMVVGARAMNDHNIPLIRKPMKWLLGKLANYLAETNIPDLNSGLRAFRKDVAFRFYKILPSGFSFTTTITLAMHCNNYKVKYIPIEYRTRKGRSKFRPIRDTMNFIQLLLRTIMYFNPLKVFLPLTAFIFLMFAFSALIDVVVFSNLTDKTVMLLVASLQLGVIGFLADLIDKRLP